MPRLPRYGYFLAFTAGAGGYALVSPGVDTLWPIVALPVLLLLSVTMVALSLWYPLRRIAGLLLLWVFLLGTAVGQWQLKSRISQQLPSDYQRLDLHLDAVIMGLPRDNGRAWVFDAWVKNLRMPDSDANHAVLHSIQGKVRLSWYKDHLTQPLQVGQRFQLKVRLRRPRGLVNPSGFDYHAWLLARSYIATGYVRSHGVVASSEAFGSRFDLRFVIAVNQLRQKIQAALFAWAPIEHSESNGSSLAHAGVLQALLLGEKSGLNADDWQLLQHTGTVHLMAISGLHVGLVAAMAFALGQLVSRLCPGSTGLLLLPALLSIVAAGFYAAVAGFSIPTQRALVLVVAFNLAHGLGKRLNPFDVLAAAAALVVILDPFAWLNAGFWLSFAAVCLLIYVFGLQRRPAGKWQLMFLSQGLVFVGLLVPLAALGLPSSLVAPLANIIAIPLVSLLVVPGLFLSLAVSVFSEGAAAWLLQCCDQGLAVLWWYFKALAQLPLPQFWFASGQASGWLVFIGGLATFLLLAPTALGLRILGAALLLLVLSPAKPGFSGLRLTVLDVGQGLAVVMQHGEYAIVYDTGDQFSGSFDVGSRILAPFLRRHGVKKVNLLIVSHGDKDHAGGLLGLSRALPITERVYGPDLKAQALLDGNVPLCQAGMHWRFGDLSLSAIHPDNEYLQLSPADNNLSCTILVEYQGFSALLPGDIETSAEYYLLAKQRLPKVDVLLAPHHGSQTSSSLSLLAKTQPQLVVFSTGYQNRYGHPSGKVLQRYQDFAVEGLNTAREGAITVKVAPGGEWQVYREKAENLRLWFDIP